MARPFLLHLPHTDRFAGRRGNRRAPVPSLPLLSTSLQPGSLLAFPQWGALPTKPATPARDSSTSDPFIRSCRRRLSLSPPPPLPPHPLACFLRPAREGGYRLAVVRHALQWLVADANCGTAGPPRVNITPPAAPLDDCSLSRRGDPPIRGRRLRRPYGWQLVASRRRCSSPTQG